MAFEQGVTDCAFLQTTSAAALGNLVLTDARFQEIDSDDLTATLSFLSDGQTGASDAINGACKQICDILIIIPGDVTTTETEAIKSYAQSTAKLQECANSSQQGWFKCHLCDDNARRVFTSDRALRAHLVAGHGVRCRARLYIGDGLCPVCGLQFHTRIRAIAHASRRTSKCYHDIIHCAPLDDERVAQLDEIDAATPKKARKGGHPTPLAILPGPSKGPKRKLAELDPTSVKRVRR